jgi:hypothetical protein
MSAPAAVHPVPEDRGVTPPALWFGLFGAPVAWSLQLLTSYALVAHGCYPDAEPMTMPVVPGLRTLVLGTGAAALVVALLAGSSAWRSWRATQDGHEALLEAGEGRTRFMALAGMLLSAVFVLGIVMNVVPLLMLRPCG